MTRKTFATMASLGLAVGCVLVVPWGAQAGGPAAPPRIARRPAPRLVRLAAPPRGIEVRRSAAIDPRILAPGDPEIDPRIVAGWPGAGAAPIGPPDVIPWMPR